MSGPLATICAALAAREPRAGATRVLAIDGRAGAGKSTLAARLGSGLGAPIVAMDSLYGGWDGLARGIATLAHDVLRPLRAGTASVPRYDWETESWGVPVELAAPEILIVEGVGSGAGLARPFISLLVWLELDAGERLARASAREGRPLLEHWEMWARQEERYLAESRPAAHADLTLDTTARVPVVLGGDPSVAQ